MGNSNTVSICFSCLQNADDLTTDGMRQGVLDSEVFVLFLSSSVLSRNFCKKEIRWAIEFGKPIICIQMRDDRFWPWEFTRWKTDRCTKCAGSWPLKWEASHHLQSTYAQCDAQIVQLIEHHHAAAKMIPFRRRGFESDAMVSPSPFLL